MWLRILILDCTLLKKINIIWLSVKCLKYFSRLSIWNLCPETVSIPHFVVYFRILKTFVDFKVGHDLPHVQLIFCLETPKKAPALQSGIYVSDIGCICVRISNMRHSKAYCGNSWESAICELPLVIDFQMLLLDWLQISKHGFSIFHFVVDYMKQGGGERRWKRGWMLRTCEKKCSWHVKI